MKALVSAGQAHGVPVAAVLSPAQILASDHFQAVGAIADAELVPGVHTCIPVGYFSVDGRRSGFRAPAPTAGHDRPEWLAGPIGAPAPRKLNRPFDWLRIIDLGIIVACGELSRLYGDLGAEVIKVESTAYPVRAAGHDELRDDTSLHDVYSCAGDDEWCVISIRTDEDWLSATTVFGMPELADDERFAPVRPGWHTGTNWQRT